ncbi:S8 family serine peptidase, partial [Kocuria sabuli]|uniref:S8 family serine peptidase n=1 Tax=Kocuria sabuli TaxID=3071448 RepID=UPI0034D3C978
PRKASAPNGHATEGASNHTRTQVVDVAAPGVNVYSTFPNHTFVLGEQNGRSWGYDVGNGTSVSSAIIAAVAALAWSSDPGATHTSVRATVESTADKITGTGTSWAHGRVNACNAVKCIR